MSFEKAQGWRLAAALIALYAAQSITGSMAQIALPAALRQAGMPLDQIGFLSLLFLPWALKVFWAPLVDRFGDPRGWILACQALLCLCFLGAGFFPPTESLAALTPFLFAMAAIAATQDVAVDAAGIHATTPNSRVFASGASTVGGYAGFLIGGGLWLWVYARYGWSWSMGVLAFSMLLLAIPAGRLKLAPMRTPEASLRRSFANRRLILGAGFLIFWQGGVRLGGAMAGPMLVDAGFGLESIAWLRGAGGMVVGLAAAIFGAMAVRRWGVPRMIRIAGAALLLALGGVLLWSLSPGSAWLLAGLQIALTAATALSFVAVYAAMMDWCAPEQAATDFALLQSLDAALAVASGVLAGRLAESFGYAPVFALAGALLLAAAPLLRRRLDAPAPPLATGLKDAS